MVLAAARHFDRHGYDGTTLNPVCAEAGVTLGALTFHFGCKAALASAVVDEGVGELQRVSTAYSGTGRPLYGLSVLVLQVATALQNNVLTRAAARLVEEGYVDCGWFGAFRGDVLHLLERASATGDLVADVRPATAARLIMYLVEGAATEARSAEAEGVSMASDFAEVWHAVLGGLAADTR
ncbi:TetR/AcrR family transcriptional regulator [Streptomyces sp. NRRL WC-3618]|uniref:TetR/AcrR family transcriptional regulator n=1 Tax=Streptomyces sp. NRRL WC-3618 TaxID=1519490 RepID=UPI001F452988|nr:TetR/AcrR family transcriptional regulator [Streptomyces sp. NRRL WC-3618]